MDTFVSELGLNIKKAREQKGWSINKLKEESGVAYSTLHDIESGKSKNLNSTNLEKVSKALNVDANDLLGITVVEHLVADLGEALDAIMESDELEIDGITLSNYEKEEMIEFFALGINNIRRLRKIINENNCNL